MTFGTQQPTSVGIIQLRARAESFFISDSADSTQRAARGRESASLFVFFMLVCRKHTKLKLQAVLGPPKSLPEARALFEFIAEGHDQFLFCGRLTFSFELVSDARSL